jgi:cytidylate kinase
MAIQTYAVTINHQVGSGGAYIGQKLAGRLGIPFLDREILKDVAWRLNLAEAELADREERLSSFWQNFANMVMLTDPAAATQRYVPSDRDMFDLECATIHRIAEKSSAIFMGRCGWYVLREHPRCVRILVTADQTARVKRLRELYKLSEIEADDLVKTSDKERGDYTHTFTKQNWLDARHYDLCVNTSAVGWDSAVDLIENCVRAKLMVPAL